MNRMKNFTVALAMLFIFTGGCGKNDMPKNTKDAKPSAENAEAAKQQDMVNHKVLSFNLEGLSERGAKKWDVVGESAESISENQIKLDNIVAKAYGEEAEAVIKADEGVYDKSKNNVMLKKNVVATIDTTQGFTGNFSDIGQSQGQDKDKDGNGKKTKGAGKKARTIITCDGEVQFDYEKNQVYFLDNVVVVNPDGVIEADKITVYLDSETRKLKEIAADGNVKITRGDNTTFSQRAKYIEADKKVTLSGHPKLLIMPDEGMGFNTNFMGEGKK